MTTKRHRIKFFSSQQVKKCVYLALCVLRFNGIIRRQFADDGPPVMSGNRLINGIFLNSSKITSELLGGSDFCLYLCPVHLGARTFLFAQPLIGRIPMLYMEIIVSTIKSGLPGITPVAASQLYEAFEYAVHRGTWSSMPVCDAFNDLDTIYCN